MYEDTADATSGIIEIQPVFFFSLTIKDGGKTRAKWQTKSSEGGQTRQKEQETKKEIVVFVTISVTTKVGPFGSGGVIPCGSNHTHSILTRSRERSARVRAGFSPSLRHSCEFARPSGSAAEIHEDTVGTVEWQAEIRQALFLQPDGDVCSVQRRRRGCALWEVEPEFLHRDRRRRLLGRYQWLWRRVRVRERLALGLSAEHHRVASTSWVRETYFASEVGEHDAQRQCVSVLLVKDVMSERVKYIPFCSDVREQLCELLDLTGDGAKIELAREEIRHFHQEEP